MMLVGGIIFTIKLYRVGLTVKEAKGVVKRVTTKPMSCFRAMLGRSSPEGTNKSNSQSANPEVDRATPDPPEELDLHPVWMRDILRTVLQDERTSVKYGKYLDQQARHQKRGESSGHTPQVLELEAPGGARPGSSS